MTTAMRRAHAVYTTLVRMWCLQMLLGFAAAAPCEQYRIPHPFSLQLPSSDVECNSRRPWNACAALRDGVIMGTDCTLQGCKAFGVVPPKRSIRVVLQRLRCLCNDTEYGHAYTDGMQCTAEVYAVQWMVLPALLLATTLLWYAYA